MINSTPATRLLVCGVQVQTFGAQLKLIDYNILMRREKQLNAVLVNSISDNSNWELRIALPPPDSHSAGFRNIDDLELEQCKLWHSSVSTTGGSD
jgi:hypothetical protein